MSLPIARNVTSLRRRLDALRGDGARIALAATMGGLHAGHLALIKHGFKRADRVVVSLFVNPTQFNDPADFQRYPRDEAGDKALLEEAGVSLLFAPETQQVLYPNGDATRIHLSGPAQGLEADFRPGHFVGVATVVAKLLLLISPEIAVFGEKDYQQLVVVSRMAQDLFLPTTIESAPTLRDDDGLALSSRNGLLSPQQRDCAPALYRVLMEAAGWLRNGDEADAVSARAAKKLLDAGFSSVDYVALRHSEDLREARCWRPGGSYRLLAAAHLGPVRLIDNIAL